MQIATADGVYFTTHGCERTPFQSVLKTFFLPLQNQKYNIAFSHGSALRKPMNGRTFYRGLEESASPLGSQRQH
jgi:hypothetical protein